MDVYVSGIYRDHIPDDGDDDSKERRYRIERTNERTKHLPDDKDLVRTSETLCEELEDRRRFGRLEGRETQEIEVGGLGAGCHCLVLAPAELSAIEFESPIRDPVYLKWYVLHCASHISHLL